MFEDESPPWDVERKYRLANLEVQYIMLAVENLSYTSSFMHKTRETLGKSAHSTLKQFVMKIDETNLQL